MSLDFYSNPDLEDGFNIWPHPWRSQPHRGLDFPKRAGTPIPSVNSGVVVISEWNYYLGNIVEVRGDDGTYIGYCHLHTPGLPVGTRVNVGDTIGPVGDTGSQSAGAHLHITRGDRQGAVRGASISYLADPWPYIQAAKNGATPAIAEEEDEDMPDSMFAVVDGVTSWCWINWATGKIYACHTQEEANWIAGYMGNTKKDFRGDPDGGTGRYKNLLAMVGILAPKVEISGGSLTEADLKRLEAQIHAGVKGAISGLTLKATA